MPEKKIESSAMSRKPAERAKAPQEHENVMRLRTLAHDLSNALEGILQASYLLNQSKIEGDARRWVQLIDTSSQEAARINREIRKQLRALSDEE